LLCGFYSILIIDYLPLPQKRQQKGTQNSAIKHFFQNKECPITNQEEFGWTTCNYMTGKISVKLGSTR